jgi:putative FmdB family regulatory protein
VPTYQYACTACGEQLEAVQSFTDAALTECPACGGAHEDRDEDREQAGRLPEHDEHPGDEDRLTAVDGRRACAPGRARPVCAP